MPLKASFGKQQPDQVYTLRPSAYALLLDQKGHLAVVEAYANGFFLPGGGIEPNESIEAAILREISEETGHDAHLLWHLAEADQYIGSWLKRSSFYLAEVEPVAEQSEIIAEHAVHWLNPQQALQRLNYESHRWIVERFEPYLKA